MEKETEKKKKTKPNPWLIVLFMILGIVISMFLTAGRFYLGFLPLYIGSYYAAVGIQSHIDKKKDKKKELEPERIPYSRDLLPPDVRKNLEIYQGYQEEVTEWVEYYAGTSWINPEWKEDIIKDFSCQTVGDEEKEISKHKDKTTSKEKTKTKKSLKTVLGNIFTPVGYFLYLNHLYISAFLSFFPFFLIDDIPSIIMGIVVCSPIFLFLDTKYRAMVGAAISTFVLKAYFYTEPIFYIWALIRICLGKCDKYLSVGFLRIGFWIAFGIWAIKFLFFAVQFVCAAIKDISNAIQRKRNKDF